MGRDSEPCRDVDGADTCLDPSCVCGLSKGTAMYWIQGVVLPGTEREVSTRRLTLGDEQMTCPEVPPLCLLEGCPGWSALVGRLLLPAPAMGRIYILR